MTNFNPTSENALESATVELFQSLGYSYADLSGEQCGEANPFGRLSRQEVVFTPKLQSAVEELNPHLPPDAVEAVIATIKLDRSAMNPVYANAEIHDLLKNGVPVTWRNAEGRQESDRGKVIDWDHPYNNDFFLARQMWIAGDLYQKRCDLVGCVNGIPLVFIELKKPTVSVKRAYDDNLQDYKNNTIPQLWHYNGFIILSNGSESKLGSTSARYEHFVEWKRINAEGEKGVISLDTMIKGTCEPTRLLDLLENFIVFAEVKGGLAKIIAKNHQYLGVRNAVEAVCQLDQNKGKLGVFWHTQGSGKSYSIVFFTQYIMRRVPGNWTFVVITDRTELDNQIYKSFSNCGFIKEKDCQAYSGDHLKQLLTEDHRFIFTLIQKFKAPEGTEYPVLSTRKDIIIITDEAHRSQYDTLAMNMRKAMPNAAFIGFTGTPLMAGEEKTRDVFGEYVSIYNFRQSIEDGATVPLYYENRTPELQLINPDLNDDIYQIIEEAELDEEQEKKLERYLGREYHLITRDERLDIIAKDLVEHFAGRGNLGKAMVVSIDRFTAVKTYNKVKKHFGEYLNRLKSNPAADPELIRYLEETDMAVIISSSQNEQEDFAARGVDILPHRKRMKKEDLETRFKDENDPLRLVFVCAMWLTGFDVPSCNTLYLDKPMKNHTLMQTIARANRVFPDKNNGIIVDYVGIFRNLQKALAIYGSDAGGGIKDGETPIEKKSELVNILRAQGAELYSYCRDKGVELDSILAQKDTFLRISMIDQAVEKLIYPEDAKKEFTGKVNLFIRLHKAVMPDAAAHEFDAQRGILKTLMDKINPPSDVDINEVIGKIEDLMDVSIAAESYVINRNKVIDLSKIDFEALKQTFAKANKRTMLERLKNAIERKLEVMLELNRSRYDYLVKFTAMISAYNQGSSNIEEFFQQLTVFMQDLKKEEERHLRENLTEEELAVFDILTKPSLTLSDKECDEVKKVAKALLKKLREEKLVLDWRKRQQAIASVKLCVEDTLDQLPEAYDKEIYQQKCDLVFQHFLNNYSGAGKSIYAA